VKIFGSKAVFLLLGSTRWKTLYFASPDYSGFAFIVMYYYVINNRFSFKHAS